MSARRAEDPDGLLLSRDELVTSTSAQELGTARARKRVEHVPYEESFVLGTEHADVERREVLVDADGLAQDSGQVETLPDGSISIPVFEERLVVEKRLVVRERVVVRKHTVEDERVVTADLRREHLEVEADEQVVVHEQTQV